MTVCVFTAASPNRSRWALFKVRYYSFYTYKTYEHVDASLNMRYRTDCINTDTGEWVKTIYHRRP